MDDYSRWLPFGPFRVPEWRWLRAEYLHAGRRRLDRRIDDAWVEHARAALRGRGRTDSPPAAVRAARAVWEGDPDRRGEIEARLLAGDGNEVVTDRMALSGQVVAAYTEVFFSVRPALATGATDWVLAQAVGYSSHIGFTRGLPWAAWWLAAVAGGPLFADVVIATATGRPLPPAFRDPGGADDMRVREMARLWVAAMAAVTPAAFGDVFRDYRRLRQDEASRRGRKVPVEPMIVAMESFMLSRVVLGVRGAPTAAVGHHEREDVGGVAERVDRTTHRRGGELAGREQHARQRSSPRPGPSARRTHAA